MDIVGICDVQVRPGEFAFARMPSRDIVENYQHIEIEERNFEPF